MKLDYYNKPGNYGYTFIELILIMAIIILLGMITLPQFGGILSNVNEEIAVDKLINDIRYTQNYALTNHTNTWFSVNLANNSYSYGFYGTAPNLDPQLLMDPATNQQSQVQLDSYPNIEITHETFNNSIDFDIFGTPSDGASITINGNIIVYVTAETGYVYQN